MSDLSSLTNPNAPDVNTTFYCKAVYAKDNLFVNGVAVSTGGSGSPNALISTNGLIPVVVGSVPVFTGDGNNFDVNSQGILVVDTSINNRVSVNGALSVSGGSQFDAQMTTVDIQVNSNSSLLLHDTTTGGSCQMYEDTNGYTEIQNAKRINITVQDTGEYVKIQTGESGYLELNNSSIGVSAYLGVDNTNNFDLYTDNTMILSNNGLYSINTSTNANFRIVPTTQPADNSIVQYQSNGECAFIPTPSGGGGVGSLINTNYLSTATAGSTFIFDGTNGTDGISTNLINVDTTNNIISLNTSDSGGTSANKVNIGTSDCYLQNDSGELILRSEASNVSLQSANNDVYLIASNGSAVLRSASGVLIRSISPSYTTTLEQQTDATFSIKPEAGGFVEVNGGLSVVGGTSANDLYKNGGNELILNGNNNVYVNSSAGSTFIQSSGGNINFQTPGGATYVNNSFYSQSYATFNGDVNCFAGFVMNNNQHFVCLDPTTISRADIFEDNNGHLKIQNNNDIDFESTTVVKTNNNGTLNKIQNCQAFSVAGRPVSPDVGECFYCLDVAPPRPLWWSGSNWVDAIGNVII